jgi:putative aldouronate transport system substrate-binding protein
MDTRKISAILLAAFLITGIFTGCGTANNTSADVSTAASTEAAQAVEGSAASTEAAPASDAITFPLKEKITLKCWIPFSSNTIKTMAENKVVQELEKRTNIHIEYTHPAAGRDQEVESFNLMIASNDLPDIISNSSTKYPGGDDKAISDSVYVKLNDYIDKYAPNYKKIRESNKDIAAETITDAGNIPYFTCIQIASEPAWDGLIIRKDWLDDLGLQMPASIDDWHNVLTQFKEKKGATVPLLLNQFGWQDLNGFPLSSAYNVVNDFYNENGTVKFGPLEPGFKDYLATLNQWVKEGLIDKDFVTRDEKGDDALFTSGKAGAMTACYGWFGNYNVAGKKVDPDFTIAGVPNVPAKAGDPVHFRQTNFYDKGSYTYITSVNKYIPETVAWLDYGYGEDGFLLNNYGVEGMSWEWKDGPVPDVDKPFYPETLRDGNRHPEYTDFMLKNPDGLAFWDLVSEYKIHQQAYMRDPMANGGMDADVQQSMVAWSSPGNDWVMPLLSHTDEENQALTPIKNDVDTFVKEMRLKFILGKEPLSKFDDFTAQIRKMGIEDAIKIKQAALDRYSKR